MILIIFNRNIRCIEIPKDKFDELLNSLFNRNIRCIEIYHA